MNRKSSFFFRERIIILILAVGFLSSVGVWLISSRMPASINLHAPRFVQINQTVEVPLTINSDRAMNAAELYFRFPVDRFQVKEIKTEGSIFQLWITSYPQYSNETGTVSLAGGLPTPGWQGRNGLIATIILETKGIGQATISLDDGQSQILANDSLGTKIEASYRPAKIRIR